MRSERVTRKTGAARAAARSGDSAVSDTGAVIEAGAATNIATCVGAGDGAAGVTDAAVAFAGATPQQRLGSAAFTGWWPQSCAQHDIAFSSARLCRAAP